MGDATIQTCISGYVNDDLTTLIMADKEHNIPRGTKFNTSRQSPKLAGRASPNSAAVNGVNSGGNSSLSTDMRCYFGCDEMFKKDYQLHLHLKLKHRNEDPIEIKR